MRIIAFGGAGFIGQYMVSELAKDAEEIVVVSRDKSKLFLDFDKYKNIKWLYGYDISSKEDLERLNQELSGKYDLVINLTKGSGYSWHMEPEITKTHVIGNQNLITLCKNKGMKYVFFSSASAHIPKYEQTNPYTYTKDKAEKDIEKEKSLEWIIFSPTEALGPGAGGSKQKLFKGIASGPLRKIDIPGDANVFDIREGAKEMAKAIKTWDKYNHKNLLVLGEDTTYKNFFAHIRNSLGYHDKVIMVPALPLKALHKLLFWIDRYKIAQFKYPPHLVKGAYFKKGYSSLPMEKLHVETNLKNLVEDSVKWYKENGVIVL